MKDEVLRPTPKTHENVVVIPGNKKDHDDQVDAAGVSEAFAKSLRGMVMPKEDIFKLSKILEDENYCTKLDVIGIDAIVENIMRGVAPMLIAEHAKVSMTGLTRWIKDDNQRSAKFKEAIKLSGMNLRHNALQVSTLKAADEDRAGQKLYVNTALKVADSVDPVSAKDKGDIQKVSIEFGFKKGSNSD